MIVLIAGRKRSGKDTAAEVLCNLCEFKRYAYADPIKVACKEIFLLSDAQIDGDLKETLDPRWNMTPREMYQLLGTELMRIRLPELHAGFRDKIGDGIWVERFLEYQAMHSSDDYVITDYRNFNERVRVVEHFAGLEDVISIRIDRDGVDKSDAHSSEANCESLLVDYVVTNNGTVRELHDKILHIIDNV